MTAGAQGHVETLYGAGFPIERHATGTFAGEMSATCDDHGRVEIEHASYANMRTYYDLANRMRSFEWDGTKDGVYDSRAFYSYDEAGRRVREVHDHGAGMAIAVIYDYRYDARGRLEAVDADRDGDGELDLTTIHEWDDLDRRISQSTFAHQELVERWRWTYDGPRELAAEIEGDYRWTNTYDDRGRLIETESRDLVADHVDGLFQQRYDDADRLIEQLQDDGADGVIDATVAFSYDCP